MNGPLGDLVKQDSRNASWLGHAVGWKGLQNEADYNTQNPGHAVTKAAETAATWYLGGLLGGAGGSAAATAGTDAAESGGTLALNAAGTGVAPYLASGADMAGGSALTASELGQMALSDQIDPSLLGTEAQQSGLLAPVSSAGSGMTPVTDLSTRAGLGDSAYAQMSRFLTGGNQGAMAGGSNTGGKGMSNLAMQMGAKMMTPQQPPPPMSPPPRGGDSGPLSSPYGSNPYGTPQGNSMGMSGLPMSLTPEQIARLRAMGYQI